MIIQDLYNILSLTAVTPSQYSTQIELNPGHEIFKGHFPNNPVLPGVCIMQILKELVEKVTTEELTMSKASNVKFLSVINPEINKVLDITFDVSAIEKGFQVKSIVAFQETVALKMSSTFNPRHA